MPQMCKDIQSERAEWKPDFPHVLCGYSEAVLTETSEGKTTDETLKKLFPKTADNTYVSIGNGNKEMTTPVKIGVVLSGGQAPGGHNVISGIYDHAMAVPGSRVYGFLDGPRGIFKNEYVELTPSIIDAYRNMGGFDMIRSGRDKIESEEQKANSMKTCMNLGLDGLVVIGGDDSNTNAAILAEYFKEKNCTTKVVGCPKTIDGDLKNEYIETSFGFDTATKVYSELVGNVCIDAASTGKTYHFIRLMGRSASNIALECAQQCQPNLTVIGEEVQANNRSLKDIVDEVVQLVSNRHKLGKNYGVVLLPEGLVEFIPEVGFLISEINEVVAKGDFDSKKLTEASAKVFNSLPHSIQQELLLDRDPHGNVQVAKIATEGLLIKMVSEVLRSTDVPFHAEPYYFGYEGRCAMPTNFDSSYCYSLGRTASVLIRAGRTGYMAVVRNVKASPEEWTCGGCPIVAMMNLERRKGKDVPVIKKYLVELDGPLFLKFKNERDQWKDQDKYLVPGPIQYHNNEYACPLLVHMRPIVGMEDRKTQTVPLPKCLSQCVRLNQEFVPGYYGKDEFAGTYPRCAKTSKEITVISPEGCDVSTPDAHVGIVLLGEPSPGVHNVVLGAYHRLLLSNRSKGKVYVYANSQALIQGKAVEVTTEVVSNIGNTGGWTFGPTDVRRDDLTEADMAAIAKTCKDLKLNGLIVLGATYAAEMTLKMSETLYNIYDNKPFSVVYVPACSNQSVYHQMSPTTLGFNSASSVFASLVGNLLTDAASAAKYWYFVRVSGGLGSHSVLDVALRTNPDFAVISEKYAQNRMGILDVVQDIADLISRRAESKRNFGTVVVPEGLLHQLTDTRVMCAEVEALLATGKSYTSTSIMESLSPMASVEWNKLPSAFKDNFLRSTPTGLPSFSNSSVEILLCDLVKKELSSRKTAGTYLGSFAPVCHSFSSQGRGSTPSEFDATLGVVFGHVASILCQAGETGVVASVESIAGPVHTWRCGGYPLLWLHDMTADKGCTRIRGKPGVSESTVSLQDWSYQKYEFTQREKKSLPGNRYVNPGTVQFDSSISMSLDLLHRTQGYYEMEASAKQINCHLQQILRLGGVPGTVWTAGKMLTAVEKALRESCPAADLSEKQEFHIHLN